MRRESSREKTCTEGGIEFREINKDTELERNIDRYGVRERH